MTTYTDPTNRSLLEATASSPDYPYENNGYHTIQN